MLAFVYFTTSKEYSNSKEYTRYNGVRLMNVSPNIFMEEFGEADPYKRAVSLRIREALSRQLGINVRDVKITDVEEAEYHHYEKFAECVFTRLYKNVTVSEQLL